MMVGFAMGCLGFIVVFPILGYATWHAYSDTLAKQTVSYPSDYWNAFGGDRGG